MNECNVRSQLGLFMLWNKLVRQAVRYSSAKKSSSRPRCYNPS